MNWRYAFRFRYVLFDDSDFLQLVVAEGMQVTIPVKGANVTRCQVTVYI